MLTFQRETCIIIHAVKTASIKKGRATAQYKTMNRRLARETVFHLLFEKEFHKDREAEEIYATAKAVREWKDDPYIEEVFFGVLAHREKIGALIEKNSHGWKKSRISAVSLAAMELSVFEMLYRTDIPLHVSINEALELVKSYDDEGARAFVNGVLHAVSQEKKNTDDGE